MRKVSLVVLLVIAAAVLSFGQVQEYKIDSVHSSATFKVKHMLVSTVVGRFTDVEGTIWYDAKDPAKSKVEAIIKTASINTDNSMRDGDLKENYFEVAKYPEMKFTSTKVEKRGDQWVATGPLTIKDVTKTVELPFELTAANTPMFGPSVGATSDFKVNRNDYNVKTGKMVDNGSVVGNDIAIELNVEAHQPKAAK